MLRLIFEQVEWS